MHVGGTSGLVFDSPEKIGDFAENWSFFGEDEFVEDGIPFLVEVNADVDGIHRTQFCWCHIVNIRNGTVYNAKIIDKRRREPFSCRTRDEENWWSKLTNHPLHFHAQLGEVFLRSTEVGHEGKHLRFDLSITVLQTFQE